MLLGKLLARSFQLALQLGDDRFGADIFSSAARFVARAQASRDEGFNR
ncbi:MAG: hypothetical protein V4787_09030 [Pseudomonadota bacterium]